MNAPENIVDRCVESYGRLKHLKLVGEEIGIPWQTVYIHLKASGVAVTGDKSRYGSDKDRLAARAEHEFQRLIPNAQNNNAASFQPVVDFSVYSFGVDVKASLQHPGQANGKYQRWMFSMKKQERIADFIVCFGYHDERRYDLFLLPGEVIRKFMTVSIPITGRGKWRDYQIQPHDLRTFFDALPRE